MLKRRSAFALLLVLALLCSALLASCGSESSKDSYNTGAEIYEEPTDGKTEIGTATGGSEFKTDAKIIRNVNLSGETKDFDSALESLKSKISENGGYVEKSNISGGESLSSSRRNSRTAVYTIRIPAEKLDAFLEATEAMLNIVSSSETTTDVTLEYYDIESRMKTLETKKAALEAMLEQATTLEEIRVLQDDLYEVIADIEAYRAKLNVYDSKVNYSTVELRITEVLEYTELNEEEPTFGQRISEAFTESWAGFGEFCGDFAVFMVGALPVFLVMAIIAAIVLTIIFLCKRKNRRRAKERAEKENIKF